MNTEILQYWIARISAIIAFIGSLYILWRNQTNKRKAKKSEINQKNLHLWSSITIYISPISILLYLCDKVPIICVYTGQVSPLFWFAPKITLTYFQLSRLQLLFSSQKEIQAAYAYPKYFFIILYSIGFLILVYLATIPPIFMKVQMLSHTTGCVFTPKQQFPLSQVIAMISFMIWDWTIVILYIFKMRQLQKGIEINCNTREVLERVNLQLNKILFLTLIFEMYSNVVLYFYIFVNVDWGIEWAIDYLLVPITNYFMLDHNCKDYAKLLLFFHRIGCIKLCCCCFNIKQPKNALKKNTNLENIKNQIETAELKKKRATKCEIQDNQTQKMNIESIDTKSVHSNVNGVVYVDKSERTRTEI